MATTLDLINAIEGGKSMDCERTFAELVQARVATAIEARTNEVRATMFDTAGQVHEAVKLGSSVTIHAPGQHYHGKSGVVGEIRHGAYKGAPKTYTC